MEGLLITGIILLVIAAVIFIIKRKINSFTRRYLNMGASETVKFLADGIKNESKLPQPITNLSEIYRPQIARDFPEVGFNGMVSIARNGLNSILNSIEAQDITLLDENASQKLKNQVQAAIDDDCSMQSVHHFDNVKIHKIGVSRYSKGMNSATADFEVSFQSNNYVENSEGKITAGSKTELTQSAYKIVLTYDMNVHEQDASIMFASTCPNCGAPVSAMGANKVCKYCGTGITEIEDRVWRIDSFKLLK